MYLRSKKLVEQAVADTPTNNDVSIKHYSWLCVQNCDIPRFVWSEVIKEKFPIMRVTKSYGPFTAERSGNQMRINLNSPVPMAFALVSSEEAAELRTNPDNFYSAIAKSSCQQRAAQKMNMTCPIAGGPKEMLRRVLWACLAQKLVSGGRRIRHSQAKRQVEIAGLIVEGPQTHGLRVKWLRNRAKG